MGILFMQILFTRIHFTQVLNFRVSWGIRIEFWSYFLYLDSLYAKIWLTKTAKDTKFVLSEDLLYLKTIKLVSCMRKLTWLAILVFIWPKIVFITMNKVCYVLKKKFFNGNCFCSVWCRKHEPNNLHWYKRIKCSILKSDEN